MLFTNKKSFEEISHDILTNLINKFNVLAKQLEIQPFDIKPENKKKKCSESLLVFAQSIREDEKLNAFHALSLHIALRVAAFEGDYQEKTKERTEIIRQYLDFSKTLNACLTHNNSDQFIKKYLNKPNYHAVGCTELIPKNRTHTLLSYSAITIGMSLVAVGFSLAFTWPLAAIALPIALLILAPAIANLVIPQDYDTAEVKSEEENLFNLAKKALGKQETDLENDLTEEELRTFSYA